MERRLFKDAPEKALPQAVCDDLVDVMMVQVGGEWVQACLGVYGEGGGCPSMRCVMTWWT